MKQFTAPLFLLITLLLFTSCQSLQKNTITQVCSDTNRECAAQCRHFSPLSNSNLKSYMQPDAQARCQAECGKSYEACLSRTEKASTRSFLAKD